MIDAIDALAFSMHANKGVYAVLLGSGVSRAARIPTGWEITLELARKVAALEGTDCGADPAAWFLSAKGEEPDYSKLLDALAKTATERQQLLRPYWEPTEQEREEGAKLPTKAHRAIADLVRLGYVRIVLTTNFDRLLETALHDVGIQPTVLSTPDQLEGALPLIHTACTIIKIHGDYLDTRIRNTPEELAAYPEQFNRLLDRVFDEFGLVISGWSADWDEALRSAMTRAPYRRFSTYWASRGDPSAKAADLIARKGATLVRVADADTFFVSLSEKVQALEEFSRPHPLSTEAAVASLKKYLSEPKYRIALDDVVSGEVDRYQHVVSGKQFRVDQRELAGADIAHRLQAYEAGAETLIRMAFVAGQWAEGDQLLSWTQGLIKLASNRSTGGTVIWLELQRYPATLLLYSFGLGAVRAKRWASLRTLFDVVLPREYKDDRRAVELLPIWVLFERGAEVMKVLPGREREFTPLNNRLAALLLHLFGRAFPAESGFNLAFDRLEILSALNYAVPAVAKGERYWAPPGIFGWRHDNRQRVVTELRDELTNAGDKSMYVTSGLVGASAVKGLENLTAFESLVQQFHWF